MLTFNRVAAQGDAFLLKVKETPEGLIQVTPENGALVVAHSETGHNHVIEDTKNARLYQAANDEFVLYLEVDNPVELKHLRGFDTHKPLKINPGKYRVSRQREYTPEGYRRAAD